MKIFLDDERVPDAVYWLSKPLSGEWEIARNGQQFFDLLWQIIVSGEKIEVISFDHDLSDYVKLEKYQVDYSYLDNIGDISSIQHLKKNYSQLFEIYQEDIKQASYQNFVHQYAIGDKNTKEITGYSCLKFLVDLILDNHINSDINITFHTQNPIGLRNMESYWQSFQRSLKSTSYTP